jgi:Protein of unknown function (DUF3313)
MRAPPAQISSFLEPLPELEPARKTSPFAMVGGAISGTENRIYIAPVTLEYLRAPSKRLAKTDDEAQRIREALKLARHARLEFGRAFQKNTKAQYHLCLSPDKECLTLELAIIELNPNTFVGSVTRLATRAVRVPGLGLALHRPTRALKANIAIEGKLRDNRTQQVIYQFADNAESKHSILPITDFKAYGQARTALSEWAKQFEQVTRAAPGQRIKGSSFMSIF